MDWQNSIPRRRQPWSDFLQIFLIFIENCDLCLNTHYVESGLFICRILVLKDSHFLNFLDGDCWIKGWRVVVFEDFYLLGIFIFFVYLKGKEKFGAFLEFPNLGSLKFSYAFSELWSKIDLPFEFLNDHFADDKSEAPPIPSPKRPIPLVLTLFLASLMEPKSLKRRDWSHFLIPMPLSFTVIFILSFW